MLNAPFASHQETYTPDYCLQLEAAYGTGMMSEGGIEGIEQLFEGIELKGKRALDIGCGLGGIPFYLAEKHEMHVTGLEVNSWLCAEAKKRTPEHLKEKVDFYLSSSNCTWPFPDATFDLIYSKGVFTHLESKEEIFQECQRLLKKGGLLVVNDCLSPEEKRWGENIAKLVALENLAMYPESESGYVRALERNGLSVLSTREENLLYYEFNKQLVARLNDPAKQKELLALFGTKGLEECIAGYEAILKALQAKEIRLMRLVAQKQIP